MDLQPDLFALDAPAPAPAADGFRYRPELISRAEERALAARLPELPFKPFEFRGYLGNRRTVSFGYRYDYTKRRVEDSEPPPGFLLPARERIAAFAGRPPEDFVQVLVSEYAPGAGIGWHRDKPQFGLVAGLSLLAPCVLRLRRKAGEGWERARAELAARSAYLMTGPSRSEWEHSITPMDALRYSITFRTLADDRG